MRNLWIVASLAAVVALPSLANAGTACRQERKGNETVGTAIGAIAGGLIGNAISHGRDRGLATAAGAVGGGFVGNRVAASATGACPEGYVAYEDGTTATDQRGRPVGSEYQQRQRYDEPAYRSSYDNVDRRNSRAVEPWSRDGDQIGRASCRDRV